MEATLHYPASVHYSSKAINRLLKKPFCEKIYVFNYKSQSLFKMYTVRFYKIGQVNSPNKWEGKQCHQQKLAVMDVNVSIRTLRNKEKE